MTASSRRTQHEDATLTPPGAEHEHEGADRSAANVAPDAEHTIDASEGTGAGERSIHGARGRALIHAQPRGIGGLPASQHLERKEGMTFLRGVQKCGLQILERWSDHPDDACKAVFDTCDKLARTSDPRSHRASVKLRIEFLGALERFLLACKSCAELDLGPASVGEIAGSPLTVASATRVIQELSVKKEVVLTGAASEVSG